MKDKAQAKQQAVNVAGEMICGECLATNDRRRNSCWLCQAPLATTPPVAPDAARDSDRETLIVITVTLSFLVLLAGIGKFLIHGGLAAFYFAIAVFAIVGAAIGLFASSKYKHGSRFLRGLENVLATLGMAIAIIAAVAVSAFIALFVLCLGALSMH